MSYRALIYINNPLIKKGLSVYINKCFPNTEISETNSLDFLNKTNLKKKYDLFIIDYSYLSKIDLMNNIITTFFTEKKVIFLVENLNVEIKLDKKNISYLSIHGSESEVLKQLRLIFRNGKHKIKSVTKSNQNKNNLSVRELEIANLLIKGFSINEISNELLLKKSTISTYKKRIYNKTNANNLVQFIKIFNTVVD